MDESLLQALPSSCCKKAEDRGAFDTMVLETLAKSLDDHVASLSTSLVEAAAGIEERFAAVKAAQGASDEATEKQQHAASEVSTADAAEKQARVELESAKAAVVNFEPELARAVALLDEKKSSLENYETWNAGCFNMLRDKKVPVPVADVKPAEADVSAESVLASEIAGAEQQTVVA